MTDELKDIFAPEDLDPELMPYLVKDSHFQMIHHRFIIQVPYHEAMNKMTNSLFNYKKEKIQKAIEMEDWDSYIFLHERPYRMEALQEVLVDFYPPEEIGLELIASVWIDSENIYQHFNDYRSDNIFIQEFSDLMHMSIEVFDLGVQTACKDVEFIKKQEDLHSKMHVLSNTGKVKDINLRYGWFKKIAKMLLGNDAPTYFKNVVLGAVETISGASFWCVDKLDNSFWTDVLLYHFMEEAEHGIVTSSHLRKKSNPVSRFLLGWIGLMVFYLYFFCANFWCR